MVKGVSKQIVLVKPQGEAAFEQAIFIVKDQAAEITEKELLRQAGVSMQEASVGNGRNLTAKVISFLSGAGLVGIGWLLTAIF